jgi:hypothetical protein
LYSLINVVTAAADQTFEVLNFVFKRKDDLPFTFCKVVNTCKENNMIRRKNKIRFIRFGPKEEVHIFFFIWFVKLLALRPLLASCASLG